MSKRVFVLKMYFQSLVALCTSFLSSFRLNVPFLIQRAAEVVQRPSTSAVSDHEPEGVKRQRPCRNNSHITLILVWISLNGADEASKVSNIPPGWGETRTWHNITSADWHLSRVGLSLDTFRRMQFFKLKQTEEERTRLRMSPDSCSFPDTF